MAVKELSDGGADGVRLGQSTSDKVGFFGTTPAAKSSTVATAVGTTAITTVVATVVTSTVWATAVNDLIAWRTEANATLNQMRTDLVNLGLLKGS